MNDIRQQIAQVETEIEQQQIELADLEAEVLDLQRELKEFEARYDRVVKPVAIRLEAAQAAIRELEDRRRRTWTDHPLGDYNPLPSEWEPPPDYVPVEEQYRQTWRTLPPVDEPPDSPTSAAPKPRHGPDDRETRVKKLFRQLARRYHPDLTTDPIDRHYRTRLMARINEAYAARDLEALEALASQPENVNPEEPLAALRLKELRQISRQLQGRIAELRFARTDLLASDRLKLAMNDKINRRRGHDMLAEMAAQMEREYQAAMIRLEQLRRW